MINRGGMSSAFSLFWRFIQWLDSSKPRRWSLSPLFGSVVTTAIGPVLLGVWLSTIKNGNTPDCNWEQCEVRLIFRTGRFALFSMFFKTGYTRFGSDCKETYYIVYGIQCWWCFSTSTSPCLPFCDLCIDQITWTSVTNYVEVKTRVKQCLPLLLHHISSSLRTTPRQTRCM